MGAIQDAGEECGCAGIGGRAVAAADGCLALGEGASLGREMPRVAVLPLGLSRSRDGEFGDAWKGLLPGDSGGGCCAVGGVLYCGVRVADAAARRGWGAGV